MLSFSTPCYPSRPFRPSSSSLSFSHSEFEVAASYLPSIVTSTEINNYSLGGFLTTHPINTPNIHLQQAVLPQASSFFSSDVWNLDSSFWEPIKLSTLAGLSTCVGASVAFLVGIPDDGDRNNIDAPNMNTEGNRDRTSSNVRLGVGPNLLAFSLAMAGSVMITVCIVSIIPECLLIIDDSNVESSDVLNLFGNFISSQLLLHRGIGFAFGWGTYALLSKWLAVLPEQDEWSILLAGDGSSPSSRSAQSTSFGVASLGDSQMEDLISPNFKTSEIYDNAEYNSKQSRSWRLTILLFLSLLLHNFPEGLAVAFSAASSAGTHASSPSLSSVVTTTPATETMVFNPSQINPIASGVVSFNAKSIPNEPLLHRPAVTSSIALPPPSSQPSASVQKPSTQSTSSSLASIVTISIALHNIPEGIAIAIPCMAARPDKPFLAFGLASLSGLAEPVGAFIGLMILRLRGLHTMVGNGNENGLEGSVESVAAFSNGQDIGDALAFVAGIMLAVAICELLPEANQQRQDCDTSDSFVLGIALGVGVMVLTELYLGV